MKFGSLNLGRYDFAGYSAFIAYSICSLSIPIVLVAMGKDLNFPLDQGGMSSGGVLHLLRSIAMVQERERGQDRHESSRRQNVPPGNSGGEQPAAAQNADPDSDGPERVGDIHIFFRRILMQVLHKRGGDSFAEAFSQPRRQQEREQQRAELAAGGAAAEQEHSPGAFGGSPEDHGELSGELLEKQHSAAEKSCRRGSGGDVLQVFRGGHSLVCREEERGETDKRGDSGAFRGDSPETYFRVEGEYPGEDCGQKYQSGACHQRQRVTAQQQLKRRPR